ncbi:MAG: hypothetical protein ACKVVT_09245 [Dehalococcoidia bacterium]
MPDRGLLDLATVAAPALGAAAGGLRFEAARWAQITFEVDQAAALSRLPADAGRPIPTYARLLVIDGPHRVALLAVGGRHKLLPRNVLVEAIVDGDADAVAGAIGGPCRPGRVSLERAASRLTVTVADAASGPLATMTLPDLRAVDPGMLRWDPWLTFAGRDGVTYAAEVAAQASPTEAFLSKGATLETPPSLGRGHLWRQFRNLQTISACFGEGQLAFSAPAIA